MPFQILNQRRDKHALSHANPTHCQRRFMIQFRDNWKKYKVKLTKIDLLMIYWWFISRPTLAIYNKHKRQNISTPPNIGKQQLPNASAVNFFVCSLDPSGNKASHSSAGGEGGGEGGKKLRGGERILTLKNGSKRKEFFMSKPKKNDEDHLLEDVRTSTWPRINT